MLETLAPLRLKHDTEKERLSGIRDVARRLEEKRAKLAQAEAKRDTALAADLRFGAIPDLERKLEQMQTSAKAGAGAGAGEGLLSEVVGPEAIAEVVARWTGIPVSKLTATDRERLLNLAHHLHERIVGQDEAVDAVAEAILRARGGMSAPGRPASFLFAGSTGVGKTELAKVRPDSEAVCVRAGWVTGDLGV